MIELKGASKEYGEAFALRPTDLTITQSQTTVLLGPSGCGKSTILRLVAGLIAPTSGEVIFDGEAITDSNILSIRRRIGFVIQDGGLFPHLTAQQNITMLARHLRRPQEEIKKRVAELCRLTHFPSDGLARYPTELSGGQRQRVGLMRALMLEPDALLLDEPLGALDPMVRSSLQDELKQIFNELGQTVLMVTHDLAEARFFGDVIVLMREGRIVQVGSLESFTNNPAEPFVTEFLRAQRAHVSV